VNPVLHYQLPVGLLRVNDPADFIVVDDLEQFGILKTYIDGHMVAKEGRSLLPDVAVPAINNFKALPKMAADFAVKASSDAPVIRVIEAIEGQLITKELRLPARVVNGYIVSDANADILKIAVVNRYQADAPLAVAFIKNFGLKHGALASTVAHDCHNIIAVGADDAAICAAVNALIGCKGGVAVATESGDTEVLALPVAGLMSLENGWKVAADYTRLNDMARELGTPMHAPFMTLSFMALLVIPALKLSDKGLFDGEKFEFVPVKV